MPSVLEYESTLERDPTDTEAFVALRKAYRQAKQHDRLIVLYEKRAQAIDDQLRRGHRIRRMLAPV